LGAAIVLVIGGASSHEQCATFRVGEERRHTPEVLVGPSDYAMRASTRKPGSGAIF
jgi:hypothetical protein